MVVIQFFIKYLRKFKFYNDSYWKLQDLLNCVPSKMAVIFISVPSKAVCREISPALWKIGSTDFV